MKKKNLLLTGFLFIVFFFTNQFAGAQIIIEKEKPVSDQKALSENGSNPVFEYKPHEAADELIANGPFVAEKKCRCPARWICWGSYCYNPGGFRFENNDGTEATVNMEEGSDNKEMANNARVIKPASNPISSSASFSFYLEETAKVSVKIYDLQGRLIKTLADNIFNAGYNKVEWNTTDESGNDVGNGIYLMRHEANGSSETQKLFVTR